MMPTKLEVNSIGISVLELIEEDPLLRDLEGQPIITSYGEVVTKDIGF